MNSINTFDNIELGDTITVPRLTYTDEGTIVAIRKWNQHAMRVTLDNGLALELNRYNRNFSLSVA